MAYWSKRERSVQDGCEAFGSSEWRWSLHVTENQALCILLHVYKAFFPLCVSDCLFFLLTKKHVLSPVAEISQLLNQSVD